jgi:integrase/recombinase XerD
MPEIRSFDAAELAVRAYLAVFRGETARAYAGDLRGWERWCTDQGVELLAAGRGHIEAFAAAMCDEHGLAPASVARRISTICGFYRHATSEGFLERNPGEFVRRPHVPPESTTLGLTCLEFVAFLHTAAQLGPDANALANLPGMLGLRVSEAWQRGRR